MKLPVKKICLGVLGTVFFGITVINAVGLLPSSKRSNVSESENRTLASFPTFSLESLLDGSFSSGLDDFFTDRFVARETLIGISGTLSSYKSVYTLLGIEPEVTYIPGDGSADTEKEQQQSETVKKDESDKKVESPSESETSVSEESKQENPVTKEKPDEEKENTQSQSSEQSSTPVQEEKKAEETPAEQPTEEQKQESVKEEQKQDSTPAEENPIKEEQKEDKTEESKTDTPSQSSEPAKEEQKTETPAEQTTKEETQQPVKEEQKQTDTAKEETKETESQTEDPKKEESSQASDTKADTQEEVQSGEITGKTQLTVDDEPDFSVDGYIIYKDAVYSIAYKVNSKVEKYANAISRYTDYYPNAKVSCMVVPLSNVMLIGTKFEKKINNPLTMIDEIYEFFPDDVNCINVCNTLVAHQNEYLYYKSDHHWTALGAYYAYKDYVESIGLTATPLSSFTKSILTDSYSGAMYKITKSEKVKDFTDEVVVYIPPKSCTMKLYSEAGSLYAERDTCVLSTHKAYTAFIEGDNPLTVIKTPEADQTRSILIIKDSFANAMVPFLTENFGTIVVIDPRYYASDITKTLKNFTFTDILFVNNAYNPSVSSWTTKLIQLLPAEE